MKASIVPACVSHIHQIAERVRPADKVELWDFACVTPEQAMYYGLNQSRFAYTGFVDTEAVCMFGCNPISTISRTARPWMVGTELLDKYEKTFLRRCRGVVDEMLKDYVYLENYIDVRNVKAIAWLVWLGFSMGEPEPMGIYRKPFIKFTRGATCQTQEL